MKRPINSTLSNIIYQHTGIKSDNDIELDLVKKSRHKKLGSEQDPPSLE